MPPETTRPSTDGKIETWGLAGAEVLARLAWCEGQAPSPAFNWSSEMGVSGELIGRQEWMDGRWGGRDGWGHPLVPPWVLHPALTAKESIPCWIPPALPPCPALPAAYSPRFPCCATHCTNRPEQT